SSSINPFHCDEASAPPLFQRVKGDDVGMVEGSERAGFPLETPAAFGGVAPLRREDLQRHVAAELRVLSKVDFPHSPGAEPFEDPVMADGLAAVNKHREGMKTGRCLHGRTIAEGKDPSVSSESAVVSECQPIAFAPHRVQPARSARIVSNGLAKRHDMVGYRPQ